MEMIVDDYISIYTNKNILVMDLGIVFHLLIYLKMA